MQREGEATCTGRTNQNKCLLPFLSQAWAQQRTSTRGGQDQTSRNKRGVFHRAPTAIRHSRSSDRFAWCDSGRWIERWKELGRRIEDELLYEWIVTACCKDPVPSCVNSAPRRGYSHHFIHGHIKAVAPVERKPSRLAHLRRPPRPLPPARLSLSPSLITLASLPPPCPTAVQIQPTPPQSPSPSRPPPPRRLLDPADPPSPARPSSTVRRRSTVGRRRTARGGRTASTSRLRLGSHLSLSHSSLS